MAKKITIDHVFKIFGDAPQQALELVRQGCSKHEILERTGNSIGVFDATFTIEAGEIFVVMGLSGSGKSTLVRLLNLLIEPSAGRILVDDTDISSLTSGQLRALRRKDISMVFQSFALMPHMTVLDNTAFGLELAGVDRPAREQAAQAGHQLDAAVRAHARQHGRHMLLDGAFRQAEHLGDALVGQTIQQQRQDVALALGQAQVGRRHQHIELGGFHGHVSGQRS